MDQSQIADITEIEQLLARYAIGMTRDDIDTVIEVFTPDGTYSAFGDTYALADFLRAGGGQRRRGSSSPGRRCSSSVDGKAGPWHGATDALFCRPDDARHAHRLLHRHRIGGLRQGWRLQTRAMTFLRRSGARDSGKSHDPTRPAPSADATA